MSAVVVVLKPFSPFTKGDHEIDLTQLPPPPALDDFSPEFHGVLFHLALVTRITTCAVVGCSVRNLSWRGGGIVRYLYCMERP